jgi:prepilin peptidase CpaA
MNLVLLSPVWLIALLMIVLAIAAVEDVVRLRISNLTCVAVFVGAIVAMALHGFELGLWQNVAVFAVILAIGTAAFGAGWLGGGDVKLLAAIGLWLNFSTALSVMVAILIAGGVLGLLFLVARLVRRSMDPTERRSKVPYGLAIVGGALFVLGAQFTRHPSDPLMERLGVTSPQR